MNPDNVTYYYLTNLASINWSNPWLVGVGTAIVSGLAVNFISRALWSKRDDSEYRQKIDAANNEVIYALRPSIAEASMPTKEIIESLARATARKYGLKRESLMTLSEYGDGLIKEVMDSSFISHQQKVKYCTEITGIRNGASEAKSSQGSRLGSADPYYAYRRKLQNRAISILSFSTGLMALISMMAAIDGLALSGLEGVFSLVSVAVIVPATAAYIFSVQRENKRRKASSDFASWLSRLNAKKSGSKKI